MAIVKTNTISLLVAQESALGTAGSTWATLEPNTIGKAQAELKTVPRAPITADRQRRPGEIVDLDSGVEIEMDLTMEHLMYLLPGIMFAVPNGIGLTAAGDCFRPTAVVDGVPDYFAVPASGNLPDTTLVVTKGFPDAANNGLFVLNGASTATQIRVANTLTPDASVSDAENATLMVCGRSGATADITMTAGGNLASTALDFTTLGLTVGQWIKIGGDGTNEFATAANNGFARISAIATNLLSFDRRSSTFVSDTGTGRAIRMYFGPYYRNVPTTDADYVSRSYTFELFFDNLDGGTDNYLYPKGNYLNELTLNFPLTDKATMSLSCVGTDTGAPTSSRLTGASAARTPVRVEPFNTASDFSRLVIANSSGTTQSTYYKNLSVTLKNNVSAEKVLGTFGAADMNTGLFEADVDMQLIFDDPDLAAAVRNNSTMEVGFVAKNGDGGFYMELPSLTVGDGTLDFPVNESVLIKLAGQAFKHSTLATSVTVSVFPYLP